MYGLSEIVQLLLKDSRVDINLQNNDGETGFFLACSYNQLEIINILLKDTRVHINISNNCGITSFITTCSNGHFEIIKLLIQEPRVEINISGYNGRTAFFNACLSDNLNIINLFFSSNRKINFKKEIKVKYREHPPGAIALDILKKYNINFFEIQKDKISINQKLLFSASDGDLVMLKKLLKMN